MKKINIGNAYKTIARGAVVVAFVFGLAFTNNGAVNVANAQTVGDTDTSNNTVNSCYYFSYDMRKGSKDLNTNGEVSKLQEALVQTGYLSQDPTGYFGNATYNAVRAFQSAKGLLSSGFVGSYTRAALQSATCNTPNPNTNPTGNINLTPSTLPTIVYDQDSRGGKLSGINFTDLNNFVGVTSVSILDTNIPNIKASLSTCGQAIAGLEYILNSYGYCPPNITQKTLFIDFYPSTSLYDNTYYYFTIRINQNGTYTDKQYSFTYKKLNGGNNTSNINLTPSTLDSIVYDKDSNGYALRGVNFTDSNNFAGVDSNNVSIVSTNISGISASLSSCSGVYGSVNSGLVYSNYAMGTCQFTTYNKVLAVSFNNSYLTDNTYYYFTLRINQNGTYTDKQYSFTYKNRYNYNPNPINNCTYGYINGAYGCYYNVTCNSTYDYTRGYYINNCQYNGNNNYCTYGYQNNVYGCWYNTPTVSPCVVGTYPNNCGGGTQDGTYIIY